MTPGDPAPSEARFRRLSDAELADEFVFTLKRLRINDVPLLDALRLDYQLQTLLSEFRRRLWERVEHEADAGVVIHRPVP